MTRTPDQILEALAKPFPPQAIKQRRGSGGRMWDYVPGDLVIRRLNDATGGSWDFRIASMDWRNDLVVVVGELTIPGLGTRAGIGVQRVADNSGEDIIKGAQTDSLKKAATQFGVALDLYGPDVEAGEVDDRAVSQRPAARQDSPQKPTNAPGRNKASDRQLEMIRERWGALRLDPMQMNGQCRKWYGQQLELLTRDNAEDMIRRLDRKITAAAPQGLTPQPPDDEPQQAGMSDAEIHEIATVTGTAGNDRWAQ